MVFYLNFYIGLFSLNLKIVCSDSEFAQVQFSIYYFHVV